MMQLMARIVVLSCAGALLLVGMLAITGAVLALR